MMKIIGVNHKKTHASWLWTGLSVLLMAFLLFLITACGPIPLARAEKAISPQEKSVRGDTINLSLGHHTIRAEIANTPTLREHGLMFRETLKDNEGMIFVFPRADSYCFWMKNTRIPLTLLFLDDTGNIVSLHDMAPQSEDSHCAKSPVRYGLEIAQGLIARLQLSGIRKVNGLKPIAAH